MPSFIKFYSDKMKRELPADKNGRDRVTWYECPQHLIPMTFKNIGSYNLHRLIDHNGSMMIDENVEYFSGSNPAHNERLSKYFPK